MEHSAGFRRKIQFTRNKFSGGLFGVPLITYTLIGDNGEELGQLCLKGPKASYISATAPQDEFSVKRNFWGMRWFYDKDDKREFGRFKYGLDLKPSVTLSDGERYFIKAKRPWPFRKKKLGNPTMTARFLREDTPVLLLESFAKRAVFSNEVTAPMEGTISTSIDSNRTVAALLLFFQTFIEARNRSHH
jgi:hypothetical protein